MSPVTGMYHYILMLTRKPVFLHDVHYVRAIRLNQFPYQDKKCYFDINWEENLILHFLLIAIMF